MTRNSSLFTDIKNIFLPIFMVLGRFRKWLIVILLIVGVVLLYKRCSQSKDSTSTIEYNTNLIEKQIKNVGKLVVTEGHFAEVLTYKDQKKYLMDLVSFEKKALIIVNAEVSVAYDLSKIEYDIDETNKKITILSIPKEEIKINPNIEYYDVDQSTINPFTGEDYNKVNRTVRSNLARKIEKSSLKANAKNRLISELSKVVLLTSTLGWTLEYKGKAIDTPSDFSNNL